MDGVLADTTSSWTYVHKEFNVTNTEALQSYLRNETTYEQFMEEDISSWGEQPYTKITEILSKVPLMNGAKETVSALRTMGIKTAIVSAGISVLAERLQRELGIDRVLANELKVDQEGMLTGEGVKNVDLKDKVSAITKLGQLEGIPVRAMAYVGDSVFDVPVFRTVRKSIAFNPTSLDVALVADVTVCGKDLTKILRHVR